MDRQRSDLEVDHGPLIGPGQPRDRPGQQEVPEMALECREVERSELATDPREGSAKVRRMIGEIGHEAP